MVTHKKMYHPNMQVANWKAPPALTKFSPRACEPTASLVYPAAVKKNWIMSWMMEEE